jgi:hypothetical protein
LKNANANPIQVTFLTIILVSWYFLVGVIKGALGLWAISSIWNRLNRR